MIEAVALLGRDLRNVEAAEPEDGVLVHQDEVTDRVHALRAEHCELPVRHDRLPPAARPRALSERVSRPLLVAAVVVGVRAREVYLLEEADVAVHVDVVLRGRACRVGVSAARAGGAAEPLRARVVAHEGLRRGLRLVQRPAPRVAKDRAAVRDPPVDVDASDVPCVRLAARLQHGHVVRPRAHALARRHLVPPCLPGGAVAEHRRAPDVVEEGVAARRCHARAAATEDVEPSLRREHRVARAAREARLRAGLA